MQLHLTFLKANCVQYWLWIHIAPLFKFRTGVTIFWCKSNVSQNNALLLKKCLYLAVQCWHKLLSFTWKQQLKIDWWWQMQGMKLSFTLECYEHPYHCQIPGSTQRANLPNLKIYFLQVINMNQINYSAQAIP